MRAQTAIFFGLSAVLLAGVAFAQNPQELESAPPPDPRWGVSSGPGLFYGGFLGAAFGTVEYIELSPLVGYRFTPRFGAGVGLLYRYSKDTSYNPDLTASDYGGNVFARYYVGDSIFAQAEYDYTSHEYLANPYTGAMAREPYSSLLAGLGYNASAGRGAGVYVLVLYDFLYDGNAPYRMYNSAVQFRVGVSVGF